MPFGTARRTSIVRDEFQLPKIVNFALMGTWPLPHIRRNKSAISPKERNLHELRADSNAPSACRAVSKVSAVSILSRFAQRLDSSLTDNTSVLPQFCRLDVSNARDSKLPLRDEILAIVNLL